MGRSTTHINGLAILTNPPVQIPLFSFVRKYILLYFSAVRLFLRSMSKVYVDNKSNLIYSTAKHMNRTAVCDAVFSITLCVGQ